MEAQTSVREALGRLRYCDFLTGWRLADQRAAEALAAWHAAPRASKADAYASYVAALDDEADAAELLRLAIA